LGPLRLRAIHALDRLRFRRFCRRLGPALVVDPSASPNLRFAHMRIEPGGRIEIGARVATERQPGNHLWVQAGGSLSIGDDAWLRTEHAENRLTVFPGGRLVVGARALLNGAMLHAKCEIEIGEDSMLGFGSRVFDSDLHPLDVSTPERSLPVRIGARVWVASDVTILRGVSIGDDVAIGARSVVTRDLPSRVLAVGSPAKPIRSIDRRPTLPE
jgi:acetyltransferase-like isoleucine patch superfamily enzyme